DRGRESTMQSGFTVSFTIDTEPDNQWSSHRITSVANIDWLPPLQHLFARYGARPTYLLTHAVAIDAKAVASLKALMKICPGEIGAHMHPWDNPPFSPEGWDSQYAVFPHDLPLDLFAQKLRSLVAAITREFAPPRSYRAGRFGFVGEHVRVLEDCGFEVDCSVTPLIDRRGKFGLPPERGGRGARDFRRAPLDAYCPDTANECEIGTSRLIEIPVTSGATRDVPIWGLRAMANLPRRARGALARAGIVRLVTASPVQFAAQEIMRMLRAALRRGTPVVNFTF